MMVMMITDAMAGMYNMDLFTEIKQAQKTNTTY